MPKPSRTTSQRLSSLLMPYDLYERHAVVSRLLRQANTDEQAVILDVGGRAELLARFVPYRVVSVNVDGSGKLAGSGLALPFADNSFSAVVSIDTLEHLPRASRLPFLRECLRVARRHILFAAPLGSQGHSQHEKQLDQLYRSVHGQPHTYLDQHIQCGLPSSADLDQLAAQLPITNQQRLFAGDYVWQGKQFERAILGHRRRGILARLGNLYHHVASWALFHPVRLQDRPQATTNRFYWLLEKQ
jgi:SAM-dependent methyltransferase